MKTPTTEQSARLSCNGCWPQDDLPADVPCECACHVRMKFTMMTPRGMIAGSFEATDPETAVRIAEAAPYRETVLDGQESADPEYGYILVVPD